MKKLNKLTNDQFQEYLKLSDTPHEQDLRVRKWCDVPDNRYYSVSVYPENLAGNVWMDTTRVRVVHAPKISKSNQS